MTAITAVLSYYALLLILPLYLLRILTINDLIINWLRDNQQYALLVVPIVAFLEATIGIGVFVSGVFLLAICTVMYTEQIASLSQMLPLAFAGAMLSDHCGFYIGRWAGPKFHHTKFGIKHRVRFEKTEKFIVRFSWWAVIFGRLMSTIRSFVPFVIGVSGMKPLRFSLFDLLACGVWTTGLGLLIVGLDKVVT
ncbi:MAG: membrane-associated protein [Chitinophagales bacterium]